jgi:hypothetical protein
MSSERELWGTFSVRDHVRSRAFVAEVLLYDRLVIPVPPENDDAEYERWRQQRWKPERQRRLINILGERNLVVQIPWDQGHQGQWEKLYRSQNSRKRGQARMASAELAAVDAGHVKESRSGSWAYKATRLILTDVPERDSAYYEKLPGVDVEAVAAYPSYPSFAREVPVRHPARKVDEERQYVGLFGWDFVVPEDDRSSDEKLLEKAAKLASRSDFKEKRADFHEWRRRVIAGGFDHKSALAELEKRLKRYQAAARTKQLRGRVKTTLAVIGIAADVAALLFPPAGIPGKGLLLGAAALAADKSFAERTPDRQAQVAAMCYDAREYLRRRWWQF